MGSLLRRGGAGRARVIVLRVLSRPAPTPTQALPATASEVPWLVEQHMGDGRWACKLPQMSQMTQT